MSEKRYIHIRNWDTFQHRDTTRNQKSGAPWIKDYVGQLHDDDWLSLTCAQRGLLQGLRLMYAAARGRPLSDDVAKRLLAASSEERRRFERNLDALNHAGFIEFSDSNMRAELLATRQQSASPDVDVDRDTDVDGEEEPLDTTPNPTPPVTHQENGTAAENRVGGEGNQTGEDQSFDLAGAVANTLKDMPAADADDIPF